MLRKQGWVQRQKKEKHLGRKSLLTLSVEQRALHVSGYRLLSLLQCPLPFSLRLSYCLSLSLCELTKTVHCPLPGFAEIKAKTAKISLKCFAASQIRVNLSTYLKKHTPHSHRHTHIHTCVHTKRAFDLIKTSWNARLNSVFGKEQ